MSQLSSCPSVTRKSLPLMKRTPVELNTGPSVLQWTRLKEKVSPVTLELSHVGPQVILFLIRRKGIPLERLIIYR